MGHLASKDVYRDLGTALDGLNTRAPWNESLRAILRELYTVEEAELVATMPTGLTTLPRLQEVTGMEEGDLRRMLDRLADKGLVMDLEIGGELLYTVSPMVVGVFEYTMMRTDGELDLPRTARSWIGSAQVSLSNRRAARRSVSVPAGTRGSISGRRIATARWRCASASGVITTTRSAETLRGRYPGASCTSCLRGQRK